MTATTRRISPEDPVALVMRRPVATVPTGRTVIEVAEELTADEVGAVIVETPHGPVGLISERDVVVLLGTGGDPATAQAIDVMTAELVWADAEESIRDVAERMQQAGVRHVPIRGEDAAVQGIVSIRDVLAVLVDATSSGRPS